MMFYLQLKEHLSFFQISISVEHPELLDTSKFIEVIGKRDKLLEELYRPLLILNDWIEEKEEEPEKNEQLPEPESDTTST